MRKNRRTHTLFQKVDYSEYERRNENLLILGFKDYAQYCRSKLWKSIRDSRIANEPRCYGCGRPAVQVHHTRYTKEVLAGESTDGLYSICKRCHWYCEFTKSGKKRSPADATKHLLVIRKAAILRGFIVLGRKT